MDQSYLQLGADHWWYLLQLYTSILVAMIIIMWANKQKQSCAGAVELWPVSVSPQVPRMLVTWAAHRPIVVEYHT